MSTNYIRTRSRALVAELMGKLVETRTIEETEPYDIQFNFGNLKDAEFARPPRIIWLNQGGLALEMVQAPPIIVMNEDGTTTKTTVPAVGYRRSDYICRILERDPEQAEIVLDQLVTASRLIDRTDAIVFDRAPWKFTTEVEGRWLEAGFALIDVTVGFRTQVAAEPIGSDEDVIVAGYEFRAGIEKPAGEPMEESEYDVDRLTGPWPG